MEKTLTRSEVARHFNVCNRTVVNWRNQGLLTPLYVIKGRERYAVNELAKLALKANKDGSEL